MCRKKSRQNREIWGGGDSKSSKKERKRDNRELWNIYRGLETDVKKYAPLFLYCDTWLHLGWYAVRLSQIKGILWSFCSSVQEHQSLLFKHDTHTHAKKM